jgi:[NiFe] hydrogenase diaphorase moiety large subunit
MDVKSLHGYVGTKLSFAEASADAGLRKAEAMDAEALINLVTASGLRGRGGAGFPTGMKWKFARAETRTPKYIICNADEGEPGTFKDRLILVDFADLVFAGMAVAGKAVGAEKGILYLRAEYQWMREHLEGVLARRRKSGLLGDAIFGNKGFAFDIEIRMGAGAYICGEETALIESLEGKRGEARNRMPFPVQAGYLGLPTVVNNVETFAWVPCILEKGPEWFSGKGTKKSPGARLFSISGDCKKPGIYEYPFGTSLRRLLKDAGAEDAKAVQVGGASGVCVPAAKFDRTLAFEDLATGGSIIVFGPGRDMFAVAENFQHFFAEESCGQCVPCRLGNVRLHEAIARMREEGLDAETEETVRGLASTMQSASKCGLGQSAPNAFLSILDNFASELPSGKA